MQRMSNKTLKRSGAALVELSLILPFFVVLVLLCVDFGRFATVYTAVTNAAREGANFGGNNPFTDVTAKIWKQKITDAVTEEMTSVPGFTSDDLTVSEPIVIASQKRSRVRVEVSYLFEPAIIWPVLPDKLKITRTAEMPVVR